MNNNEYLKYQHVRIDGHEEKGVFFVRDFVLGLKGQTAELISIVDDEQQKVLEVVPIAKLVYVPPKKREPLDFFAKIVIQGLKKNVGQISQPIFYCNTIFKSYQFRPLLKYLKNQNGRILIADEAGLGKTIEAGYILINEICNRTVNRVLILCPANVQYKWKAELWHRFGLTFDIVTGKKLLDFLINPQIKFKCIASMDCLRRIENKTILEIPVDSKIDFLVIDEIHHMIGRSGDTLRRRIGLTLSTMAKSVIGLSATPVQIELLDLKKVLDVIHPGLKSETQFNDELVINSHLSKLHLILNKDPWKLRDMDTFLNQLDNLRKDLVNLSTSNDRQSLNTFIKKASKKGQKELLNNKKSRYKLRKVLAKNTFSDYFTKTQRRDVGEERTRDIRNEKIALDSTLHKAYQNGQMVESSEKNLFDEIDDFLSVSFHITHRRQLSSCLPAMINLLRRGMEGFNVWVDDRWEEVHTNLNEKERESCQQLANKFALIKKDSKWEKLLRIIKELRETGKIRKAIVFTQWIPTIDYFREKKISLNFPSYLVSGQDNEYTKIKQITAFQKNSGFAVLFTTDVLSEGLDFQSADCVINYDLPYNPQKIEQRIGRVDRIGQTSETITIINMIITDSTDEKVLELLLNRINAFEESLGNIPPTLIEKAEQQGIIDDDEVIKTLSDYDLRQELLENDTLRIFDDLMDTEIEKTYIKQRETPYALRWMAVERLMFMVLGSHHLKKAVIQKDFIRVPNFQETDIDSLTNLMEIKDKASVKAELLSNLDENGALTISFDRKIEGLYLPFFHPLMKKAIEISFSSFFPDNQHQIEPYVLNLSGNPIGKTTKKSKSIVLIEHTFEGKTGHKSEWFWWLIDAENKLLQLHNSPLEELWNKFLEKKITINSVGTTISLPQAFWTRVFEQEDKWFNRVKKDDENQFHLMKNTEIQILKDEIKRLNRVLNRMTNSSVAKKINQKITQIENKIEQNNKLLIESHVESQCTYKEKAVSTRLVGAITFGDQRKH